MKKQQQAVELEAELLRLNDLVRRRRAQLERLARCPNKDCECRRVWRETIEKDLAGQVGKISTQVATASGPKARSSKVQKAPRSSVRRSPRHA